MRIKVKKILSVTLLIFAIGLTACGNDTGEGSENENLVQEKSNNTSRDQISEEFSWDNIPVYPEAKLESTNDCAAKWAECEKCEHRVYVTTDNPEDVCLYYKAKMLELGWVKLVYQFYPEGSCLGTYNSADGITRVFMNIAQRRSDKKTFIAITMGQDCP